MLSASYWMEIRKAQKPDRSFSVAPAAALTALRTVVPWQQINRPEIPTAELVHAFMLGTPASTFMGRDADDPRLRAATKRAARKVRSNRRRARGTRRVLRLQASEPAIAGRRP
jgi:hypothetical protein